MQVESHEPTSRDSESAVGRGAPHLVYGYVAEMIESCLSKTLFPAKIHIAEPPVQAGISTW